MREVQKDFADTQVLLRDPHAEGQLTFARDVAPMWCKGGDLNAKGGDLNATEDAGTTAKAADAGAEADPAAHAGPR